MNPRDPESAQRIVADYAALLERHTEQGVYPTAARDLPYPKSDIKAAIRTCTVAMAATRALNTEMRDFLEIAYVSLADYVDDDLAKLMSEFHAASEAFANDGRRVREKLDSPSWSVLANTSKLAGDIAATLVQETETLRAEFRTFCA